MPLLFFLAWRAGYRTWSGLEILAIFGLIFALGHASRSASLRLNRAALARETRVLGRVPEDIRKKTPFRTAGHPVSRASGQVVGLMRGVPFLGAMLAGWAGLLVLSSQREPYPWRPEPNLYLEIAQGLAMLCCLYDFISRAAKGARQVRWLLRRVPADG